MANYLSPFSSRQFIDANGNPYSGALLFTYVAGSSTKVTTYKDEAGSSAHANPIVLNTRGEPADGSAVTYPIWQIGSAAVKFVLAPSTDTDPPASPIATWDNIDGINDTSVTIDQWITGPTPTYVGATSFTLVGDQTSAFHIGRRIKTTNSGGTIYSTITNSAFGASTTVTVVNDSGTLDAGLSAVSYGVLSSSNASYPAVIQINTTFQAHTKYNNGIGPKYINNAIFTASVAANAITIALKGLDGNDPSATNPIQASFRSTTATNAAWTVQTITSALSCTIPQGATLGFTAALTSDIYVVLCYDGSNMRIGVCSANAGIYEHRQYNTTILDTSSDSNTVIYTSAAMTAASIRRIGQFLIQTGATPGDWSNSPTILACDYSSGLLTTLG